MEWYNEPPVWHQQADTITATSGPKTDFWRKTHYGFIRDNGHFYFQRATGDFVAGAKISGAYTALYDQAGLMLRVDEENWVKCGIEFVDGAQYVSAVVTREFSDWSVAPLGHNPPALWLRMVRHGASIEITYALDGVQYQLLRIAYFPAAEAVSIGPMCASPDGDGFQATFEGFTVRGL